MIDMQVIEWFNAMMEFPQSASGTMTNGAFMANLLSQTITRNMMAGVDVRAEGIMGIERPLRFYASDQVHSCHQKALETLGLGSRSLRMVPSNDRQRIDLARWRRRSRKIEKPALRQSASSARPARQTRERLTTFMRWSRTPAVSDRWSVPAAPLHAEIPASVCFRFP